MVIDNWIYVVKKYKRLTTYILDFFEISSVRFSCTDVGVNTLSHKNISLNAIDAVWATHYLHLCTLVAALNCGGGYCFH